MRALTLVAALIAAPVQAQAPAVVTDIAPVHSLASLVMRDLGQPILLLGEAADPHHFQFRPSQARILSGAELLVWMGPALTPWLESTRLTMAPEARSLPLLDSPGAPLVIDGDGAHGKDDHHHGPIDPHGWLDPLNAIHYLGLIATELAALDPDNAEIYRTNAKAAATEIEALNATITPKLVPARDSVLIATHDAYSYLLARYGLRLSGALSDSAGNAPGASGLTKLQQSTEATGLPVCVLREPGTSARAILNLNLSKPLTVIELDPMGRAHAPGPGLYTAMIKDLANALAGCTNASN